MNYINIEDFDFDRCDMHSFFFSYIFQKDSNINTKLAIVYKSTDKLEEIRRNKFRVVFYILTGHQLTVFNSQSTIQVGGRWNRSKGRVERPFLGVIAGLVVNGARILELAAAKDGKVATRGDVQLLPAGSLLDRAPPLQRMQQVCVTIFLELSSDPRSNINSR